LDCHLKIYSTNFPNIPVSSLFQFICETKESIDLIAIPILPLNMDEFGNPIKSSSPQFPLMLNPVHRHYTSFANMNNVWVAVCILARVVSPNYELYYTEEKYTRKCRLYRNTEVILGVEGKRMLDRVPVLRFTDYEVLTGKECVRKELMKIL
jgi:hypothetical protein